MFRNERYDWWMSRDSTKMAYCGGASPGSGKWPTHVQTSIMVVTVMRVAVYGVKTAVS